jgi:miniconductance mechanosensitive channel
MVIDALLTALIDVYRTYPISQRLPIKAFVDAVKVIIYFFVAILTLSILLNTRMTVFFTGLGALTVVLMLVFKDTILNFVAGIQLSANNMVRVGDWLEMPRYGADGDVIDISLTTVRVQNWDKTVSTIPPYALVTDAFKNWRGMSESGGRRIKRAINIDMTSVRICDAEMLERFAKIQHIAEHIERKRKEVAEHNQGLNVSDDDLANGRHLTNLGTFRAYVEAYLRNHPKIHQEMTFLVRQLPPTDKGLPIEIYVFSNDQEWASYEAIQADIFDHIIAILPLFDLRVFQAPTGADMRGLAEIAR